MVVVVVVDDDFFVVVEDDIFVLVEDDFFVVLDDDDDFTGADVAAVFLAPVAVLPVTVTVPVCWVFFGL